MGLLLGLMLCAGVRWAVPPDVYARRLIEFSHVADEVEIITLGNSHSRSFHFASMNLAGYHFFEQNGDIEEMKRRADAIVDQLPSLRYVLIPLSPGSLSSSQRVIADDYEKRRLLIRKGTPLTFDLSSYSLEELVGTATYRLFRIDSLQQLVQELLGYESETRTADAVRVGGCLHPPMPQNPADLTYEVPEEGIIDGYRRLLMDHDCLPRYGDASSRRRRDAIERSLRKYPHLLEENVQRILTLADELEVRGVEMVIVNTPNTPWYYDSDAISELELPFEEAMARLAEHSAVSYFDFHDLYYADLAGGENRYFFDDNHLALVGAKAFSRHFARALNLASREGRGLDPQS